METAKFCYHTTWSTAGVCPLDTLHQEEEKSQIQNPATIFNQPVPVYAVGQSVGHAVESGRPASHT